ncbi:MAG: hypothetical protein L0214_04620, partial [candidate division NC10 bacterium]|nr:hypothetical protein [candidate division NC10 bacterium]
RIKTGPEPLNNFLSGGSPGPNPFGSTPGAGNAFDGGNYIVVISNDTPTDPLATVDTNNRVFIRSTGTFRTAQKQVLVLVERPPAPPAPRGAAEGLGQYTEFDNENPTSGGMDGRDWNAPADLSACTDVPNCGTLTANPATYGMFTNTNDYYIQLSNGGHIVGTGCLPPGCAGTTPATASKQIDTTVPLTRWDSFINAAIPQATRTLNLNNSFSGTYTWGTAAAPEITVINMTQSSTFGWNGTVNGAGVLIIEHPGGTMSGSCPTSCNAGPLGTIAGSGVLNWQGLVIIRSPQSVEFEVGRIGTSRLFGQIVNRSAGYAEIEMENNRSFVKYSSAALALVRQAVGGSLTVRGWQEVAM